MDNIIDYICIAGKSKKQLNRRVRSLIQRGENWQPLGGISVCCGSVVDNSDKFAQALVRYGVTNQPPAGIYYRELDIVDQSRGVGTGKICVVFSSDLSTLSIQYQDDRDYMTITDENSNQDTFSFRSECCDTSMFAQLVSQTPASIELLIGFDSTGVVTIPVSIPNAACDFAFGCDGIVCNDA